MKRPRYPTHPLDLAEPLSAEAPSARSDAAPAPNLRRPYEAVTSIRWTHDNTGAERLSRRSRARSPVGHARRRDPGRRRNPGRVHTENSTVVKGLLADLVTRGLRFEDGLLVVLDGSKALRKAVNSVFGDHVIVQRCTLINDGVPRTGLTATHRRYVGSLFRPHILGMQVSLRGVGVGRGCLSWYVCERESGNS